MNGGGGALLALVRSGITGIDQIGRAVVANREGVPVRVRDVADVTIGGDLRTGAASQNGEQAVIGTALMLLGENRSEEHTSELQSLMRISYAVFCLKKKKNQKHLIKHTSTSPTSLQMSHLIELLI